MLLALVFGYLTTSFGQIFHGAGHGWLSAVYFSKAAIFLAIISALSWPLYRFPFGKPLLWVAPICMVVLNLCLVIGTISEGDMIMRVWQLGLPSLLIFTGFWVSWQVFGFLLFDNMKRAQKNT